MSTPRQRPPVLPALDGIRAYAILAVGLIHVLLLTGLVVRTQGTIANTALWGVLGNSIDFFFIISGFVVFLPIVMRGELGGVWRYVRGRAARILPAYWACLTLLLLLLAFAPPNQLFQMPAPGDIAINYAALQMPARLFDPGLSVGFGIDGPLWMISVIVGFYVVMPLIARPYLRHPLRGLALAAVLAFAWRWAAANSGIFEALAGDETPPWAVGLAATDQLPGWAFSLALGMTGAWAYVRAHERWPRELMARRALQVLPPALLVYVAFAWGYGETGQQVSAAFTGSLARSDPLPFLAASASRAVLVAAIALSPLWVQWPFANRPIFRIAELSYGFYLVHFVVLLYALEWLTLEPTGGARIVLATLAIVFPLSLAYAFASRRLLERPARAWARRGETPAQDPGGAFYPSGASRERILGRSR